MLEVLPLSLLSLLSFACCRPVGPLQALVCCQSVSFQSMKLTPTPTPLHLFLDSVKHHHEQDRISSLNIYNSAFSQS